MSQIKIVDINDKKYIIEPFKGEKGFKLKIKLSKVVSPALKQLKDSGEEVSDIGLVFSALVSLLESTDDETIFTLVKDLISGAKTESGAINFDTEFSQNYLTLYKLLKEVIEVNYKDVFSALGMNVG